MFGLISLCCSFIDTCCSAVTCCLSIPRNIERCCYITKSILDCYKSSSRLTEYSEAKQPSVVNPYSPVKESKTSPLPAPTVILPAVELAEVKVQTSGAIYEYPIDEHGNFNY